LEKKNKTVKTFYVLLSILLMVLYLDCSSGQALNSDSILGRWRDVSGKVEIEIYKKKEKYHGKILWLKESNYRENDSKGMAGKPRIDRENPNPSLRNRPLLNMDLFWDCVFTEHKKWENGLLYDPLKGNTYRCSISMDTPDKLRVRGYIGVEIMGRTILLKKFHRESEPGL